VGSIHCRTHPLWRGVVWLLYTWCTTIIILSDKWVVLFFEMQVVTIADCAPTAGPALFEPWSYIHSTVSEHMSPPLRSIQNIYIYQRRHAVFVDVEFLCFFLNENFLVMMYELSTMRTLDWHKAEMVCGLILWYLYQPHQSNRRSLYFLVTCCFQVK